MPRAAYVLTTDTGRYTLKELGFINSFLKHGNATLALRENYSTSGMNENSINRKAHELLHKVKIASRIKELQEAQQIETGLTVQVVISGLLSEARNTESSPAARVQAWSLLGKHLGMFKETAPVHDTQTVNIRTLVVHMPSTEGRMIEGTAREVTDTDT